MKRRLRTAHATGPVAAFVTTVGMALGMAGASGTLAADEVCEARFADAYAARDVAAVAMLMDEPATRQVCLPAQLEHARGQATRWLARRADVLVMGGDPGRAERLLEGADGPGLRLAPWWHVNAVLGDIAAVRDDWSEAAVQYGYAYELSVDESEGDTDPRTRRRQLALFERANEALMLSGSLSAAISRSGETSGILGTRGPKPRAVPVPVRFETAKATFTTEGQDAATRLARAVIARDLGAIELVGHADPRGDDAYNAALSQRRAVAVATVIRTAFAEAGRTPPRIEARGEGERCPALISDRTRYTREQRYSLHRRVEIVLDPGLPVPARRCGEPE